MTASDDNTQPDSLHGPNLILDVENFGPIAEAKNIEFKPMTVFVGPSNTGKTYLAMLLHAFLQSNPENYGGIGWLLGGRGEALITPVNDELPSFWRQFTPRIAQSLQSNPPQDVTVSLDSEVSQRVSNSILNNWLNEYVGRARRTIGEFFEVTNISALTTSSKLLSVCSITVVDGTNDIKIALTGDHSNQVISPSDLTLSSADVLLFHDNNQVPETLWSNLANVLSMAVTKRFYHIPKSFYFPAGRAGIINAHRLLVSSVVENAARFGMKPSDQITYNRLSRDFLRLLIEVTANNIREVTGPRLSLDGRMRPDENFMRRVETLERAFIPGKIKVIDAPVLPEYRYAIDGVEVPLFRASSMISELAPIILFLRHHIGTEDLIIIDEPEAHLHPEAQQQMAAALAFMVRSGLRVLVTTHSHYMVEQLGNFVAVSTLDEDMRKRSLKLDGALGDEDIYLDESEVAVYDFATDKSEHGSVVETVEFNQDYGYFPRDHNWAIADQMNRTQRVIEARIDQDDPVSV